VVGGLPVRQSLGAAEGGRAFALEVLNAHRGQLRELPVDDGDECLGLIKVAANRRGESGEFLGPDAEKVMHGQIPWGQKAWPTRDGHQGICRASGECLALPVSGVTRRLSLREIRRQRSALFNRCSHSSTGLEGMTLCGPWKKSSLSFIPLSHHKSKGFRDYRPPAPAAGTFSTR
jgi:hypothetical protein